MNVKLFIVVSLLILVVGGQETLYGLPPIPGEPLPTTTARPSSTHRIFRLPFFHPTLAPFLLAHPFDPYNNINPIPELPPQPESKYNGYYDLDGNFVSYTSDRARGYAAGKSRPKRDLSETENTDESLRKTLLDEEYAYDDEPNDSSKNSSVTTTPASISSQNTTKTIEISQSNVTESSNQNTTTKQIEEVKPIQLPTRPLFVSGNAKVVRTKLNTVEKNSTSKSNKQKMVDNKVSFNRNNSIQSGVVKKPKSPYQVNRKPTQISSQKFAKGLILPRQHQILLQSKPPPNLQAKFINTNKLIRNPVRITTQRPRLPTRVPPAPLTRGLPKVHSRQFVPSPLKVVSQNRPQPQFYTNQQQFNPLQQRAWAAPSIPDTRDPTVIAYLRDVEDYDWAYTGGRPDLERPARIFQQQNAVVVPETLVPLSSGIRQQVLVPSTLSPYISPQATASYTAPSPQRQTSAPNPYQLPQTFTAAPGTDLLGLFGGTPHPLLDISRLFGGGFAGRR